MNIDIKTLSSKKIYSSKVFYVLEEEVQYPNGKVVQRGLVKHSGAAVVLPIADDGTLFLVNQYRHAIRQVTLEFPAGTLEPGESPEKCAAREITEEIGQTAKELIPLGHIYPAPGFCDELQHLFLARGLSQASGTLDEDEILEVRICSVVEVERAICNGELCDAKSIALFARARLAGLV